jgi:hypothetical protein
MRHVTGNPDAVTRNEAKVLSYLLDDYCGLWEVLATVENDLACARLVLESLIARGWVQLFQRRGPSAFKPLETAMAHDALRAPEPWRLPPDALWVTTTVSGEEAYESLPEQLLPHDLFPESWVNPRSRA